MQGLTDPDDAPEAPEHPVSRTRDLWLLGRHRLLCGDSTVASDVERVLGGVEPHLMVTDPLYGVNYDPAWRNEAGRSVNGQTVRLSSDKAARPLGARAVGKVENDDRADWSEAWVLFPGTVVYVWHAGIKAGIVQASLEACGFDIERRSSGRKTTLRAAAAIITANTSRAGTRFARARRASGPAIISKPRCGTSTRT